MRRTDVAAHAVTAVTLGAVFLVMAGLALRPGWPANATQVLFLASPLAFATIAAVGVVYERPIPIVISVGFFVVLSLFNPVLWLLFLPAGMGFGIAGYLRFY